MTLASGLGALFCGSGAALLFAATWHFVRRRAFLRSSAVARGTVVALRQERDGSDTHAYHYPQVRFTTAAGRVVTFESGQAESGRGWDIGAEVPVRYQPGDPQSAELGAAAALWGPTLVFACLAVVFLGVGISLLLGLVDL